MDNDIDMDHFDHDQVYIEEPEEEFVEEPMGDGDFDMAAEYAGFDQLGMPEGEIEEPTNVTVVETTTVDLESLVNEYSDYALMSRLLFIAKCCPPLKIDALRMLIDYVKKHSQNVRMMENAQQCLEELKKDPMYSDRLDKIPEIDTSWMEQTKLRAAARLDSCLAEFKRQRDDAVKESIRRSLDEVFLQYVQMGELNDALKLYGRGVREYCTAPNYFIQMLINWINVTIYAEQWPKLGNLLSQAERTICEIMERDSATSSSSSYSSTSAIQPKTPTSKNYKELVQTCRAKISAVIGLAKMQERNFRQAAEKFITVDIDALNYRHLLSSNDIAVYGSLCALATFSRVELKERVIGNPLFRKALESEPRLIEVLLKFCRSQFGEVEDILNEMKDQFLLNIFLASHIRHLYASIRESALVQYFEPYVTADINQMAVEFRTTPEAVESDLVVLIENGALKARIDSYNKILHARLSNNRSEIYNRIVSLEKDLNNRVVSLLIRGSLQSYKSQHEK